MTEIEQCLDSINQSLSRFQESVLSHEKKPVESIEPISISADDLTRRYLTPSSRFSTQWLNQFQCIPSISSLDVSKYLYDIPEFSLGTEIKFFRQGLDARIVDFEQNSVTNSRISDSKTSLSLTRQFNPKSSYNQANSESVPFAPGGLTIPSTDGKVTEILLHRDSDGLYDIPPGFSRGLQIDESISSEETNSLKKEEEEGEQIEEPTAEDDASTPESVIDDELIDEMDEIAISNDSSKFDIDSLLPKQVSFGRTVLSEAAISQKTVKQWAHTVSVDQTIDNFDQLVPNPAKKFPFELDTFQKEAISHLEQGDSVFIAAHTSAGKTVVAEYAIAMAQRNLTKCIYTSPIKALSNQKYRDFKQVYEDVGLLTGDVQINPEASCLIMTTEILRSMLYRGADLIRDVEFVIFDEVHYVNDHDRGVVWEESIIMLPEHVKFVLLSATVPNTFEFADWIGRTKKKDIYVISTSKRPVPLEHYLWSKNNMYKIVDSESNFIKSGWKDCETALVAPKKDTRKDIPDKTSGTRGGRAERGARGGARGGTRGGTRGSTRGSQSNRGGSQRGGYTPSRGGFNSGGPSTASNRFGARNPGQAPPTKTSLMQLCQFLSKDNKLPAVFFVFSQKRCQEYALMLSSLDYCSAKEKSEIRMFIDKAVMRLKKEDRELPQILMARDILSRGIGIHHGGLLPIVKEVIEILFAKSLIKILFATETIAMGLNLPMKTVIYTGTRKNDGNNFRMLYSGEYTQMSGRAGRRGLDSTGTAIIMVNDLEPPSISSLKAMILEPPTRLHSQFKLTYSMILNLLRVEALKVEEMIKRSFSEHASQVLLPEHEKSVKLNEDILAKLKRTQCPVCDIDIEQTYKEMARMEKLTGDIIREILISPNARRRIFVPGRIVIYRGGPSKNQVYMGVIFSFSVASGTFSVVRVSSLVPNNKALLPLLMEIESYRKKQLNDLRLGPKIKPFIEKVEIEDIKVLAEEIYEHALADLVKGRNMDAIKDIRKVFEKLLGSPKVTMRLPIINGGKFGRFQTFVMERNNLLEQISNSKTITCKNFPVIYSQVHEQHVIRDKIKSLKSLMSDQNLELLPDYEQRIAVLKDLGYLDDEMNVLLKGRVACEINVGFELVITELLLDNFLGSYEPEEIVALMSVFVYEGGTKLESSTITQRLDEGKEKIAEIVKTVNGCFEKHQVQLTMDESEFLEKNRFGVMEAVYEWSRGMSFNDVTKLTDIPEGKIVRIINRLDEVFRQVMVASNLVGDISLHDKVATAKESIKRDIVFCASLYL